MKAITQYRYGGTEQLQVEDIEAPTPGPTDVLVRVRAAAVDRGTVHLMTGLPYAMRLGFGMRGPKHRVVAGATREDDSGWTYAQTAGGVKSQLDQALAVAPGLANGHLVEVRIGFRPASRDGMPFLGQIPGYDHIFVASGHGPGGLQNGPVSGTAIANLALGLDPGFDLTPFDPSRPTSSREA